MIFPFNFSPEFAPLVLSGQKRQTFRRERQDKKRPRPGDTFRGYVGLRTRNATLLVEAPVLRCRGARLDVTERTLVIDGHNLTSRERHEFARHDGFPNFDALVGWFGERHAEHLRDGQIEGFVVEWDWDRRTTG